MMLRGIRVRDRLPFVVRAMIRVPKPKKPSHLRQTPLANGIYARNSNISGYAIDYHLMF